MLRETIIGSLTTNFHRHANNPAVWNQDGEQVAHDDQSLPLGCASPDQALVGVVVKHLLMTAMSDHPIRPPAPAPLPVLSCVDLMLARFGYEARLPWLGSTWFCLVLQCL